MIIDKNNIERVLEDAWMKIIIDHDKVPNILDIYKSVAHNNPEVFFSYVMSRPEYFYFFVKHILNIRLLPFQGVILNELWHKTFPLMIMNRGAGKTTLLAIYNWLRLLILPRRKIVCVGAAFRQSKFIFSYMEQIYNNAPLLRDILGSNKKEIFKHEQDRWRIEANGGHAVFLPVGDGSTIRGERANDIQADEFNSQNKEVFETVVAGFASVSANPIENVRIKAKQKMAQMFGIELDDDIDQEFNIPNQILITGTAGYSFQLMAEYWNKYKRIIEHEGAVEDLVGKENSEHFKTDGFSIIRIPAELIDFGFMDETQLARSRATMHSGTYANEYGSVFSKDSIGFFRRTLIELCTPSTKNIIFKNGEDVKFKAAVIGNADSGYVIGIDPAADQDNFAIVIIEICEGYRKIVYSWTTNTKDHKEKIKSGSVKETDYYRYCHDKIRRLMRLFPCKRIAIDKQGGGLAILELFKNKEAAGNEPLILPTIDFNKPKDTDNIDGLHIIDTPNFAQSDWVCEANNGLRLDFEQQNLLFPFFDSSQIGLAGLTDSLSGVGVDNLEDCILEIEELKNELTTIVLTKTANGRDRWDTPEIKLEGAKKGRMRKDRYTALMMANDSARRIMNNPVIVREFETGGFAERTKIDSEANDYIGPNWFTSRMKGVYS